MIDSLTTALSTTFLTISSYIPKLVAGILILIIGLVISSLIKDLLRIVFTYFRIDRWLEKSGIVQGDEVRFWPRLLAELIRWTIIFVFLMSAVDTWGIPKVADVLNQLLQFLPNVFVAVIIGWVGIIAGKLAYNIVCHSVRGLEPHEMELLGNVARYAIIFFTALIVLTQLGIAADLVKILFMGIVGMLALSGGLAFGLGGQEEAKKILQTLRKRLEKKP